MSTNSPSLEVNLDNNEAQAAKILSSIKFYTLSKNTKRQVALKHYLIAKQSYEELKVCIPSLKNVTSRLIQLIKKIIDLKLQIQNNKNGEILTLECPDINHLYFHLADLCLEDNNLEEIICCYDKIINTFVREATSIKFNFTFNYEDIVDLIRKLINKNHYCYALLYALRVQGIFEVVCSFNIISLLNVTIAVCYLNLNELGKAAEIYEDEYNRILSRYEGIYESHRHDLMLMIIVYALHDTMVAKKKIEKYCEAESSNTKMLYKFIELLDEENFIDAKKFLQNNFELMNVQIKFNIIEIINSQYAKHLVIRGIKKNNLKLEVANQ